MRAALWLVVATALLVVGVAASYVIEGPTDRALERPAQTPRATAMVVVPAGKVRVGDDRSLPDERPAFAKTFGAFLLDRTPVTVAQFEAFVRETGYVTDAERYGHGGVLDRATGTWALANGATWRRPEGANRPAARADHPVTQVSWWDADAFCQAYGARLPTEFEWERAAQLGQTPDGHVFRAGDPRGFENRRAINVWQGAFPIHDTGEDGYRSTSPVGAFGEAPSGLTDMAGNVWEWTASWYRPYASLNAPFDPDPSAERVQRGGSFLCDPSLCAGFRATARNHSTPETSLMHVGFRCAADRHSRPAVAEIRTKAGGRTF